MKSTSSVLMMPLSTLFRAVTEARQAAYRNGFFKTSRLAAPVISVGNITTGGTGKTPLVEWVCRTIAASGKAKQVCVLTRGYGKENPREQVLVSDGATVLAVEREAGDEPIVLANNLLGIAAVVANPDRVAAGEWAIPNLHADAFVLDDGFQHLRIARDLDIVAVDATNPFSDGELLPSGRLREAPKSLARADCIVITRSDQSKNVNELQDQLRKLVGAETPIFTSRMEATAIRNLSGRTMNKTELQKQPMAAFCGVGNPKSFFDLLRDSGYQLTLTRAFPDHHRCSQPELDELYTDSTTSGARALITTAKDAVKLQSAQLNLPCYVLEIRIAIADEEKLAAMVCDSVYPRKNSQ